MLREYGIFLFGFPARVIVWILIAFFLGLIFSMMQWPSFWRRLFDKQHKLNLATRIDDKKALEEKAQLSARRARKVVRALLIIVAVIIFLVTLFYIVGVLS